MGVRYINKIPEYRQQLEWSEEADDIEFLNQLGGELQFEAREALTVEKLLELELLLKEMAIKMKAKNYPTNTVKDLLKARNISYALAGEAEDLIKKKKTPKAAFYNNITKLGDILENLCVVVLSIPFITSLQEPPNFFG